MLRITRYFWAIFLTIVTFGLTASGESGQPNIIFLVLDDVSFDDIGVFRTRHSKEVLTPNLDRFAESSVRLTNLHSPSSICTPARYSYLTGKFAGRADSVLREAPGDLYSFVRWNSYIEPGDREILPHYLRQMGYTTGMIGKWHISEIRQDIPENVPPALLEDNPDPRDPVISKYLWNRYDEDCRELEKNFGFDHVSRFTEGNAADNAISLKLGLLTHNPEWVVEGGLEFIEENKEKPFFMYMALTLLHDDPVKPLKEQSTMLTPAGYLDEPIDIISSRADILQRSRSAGLPDAMSGSLWLDELFGALIAKLEGLNLRDNTLIILTSDHGLEGKGTCYEGGTKSMTMVSWPGRIQGGTSSDALLSNVDHMPTILDAVGSSALENTRLDGLSYLPVLTGEKTSINSEVFFELGDMRGIRTNKFKYIARRPVHPTVWDGMPQTGEVLKAKEIHDYYFRDYKRYLGDKWYGRFGKDYYLIHAGNFFDRDQLYYLDNDRDELENLAGNPDYANELEDLKQRLSVWLKTMPGGNYPL